MNKPVIGILGGGQLARMSAYYAYRLGLGVSILEKTKDSPAGQLTKNEFVGWVDDEEVLKKFAGSCDIITLENEFIDSGKLKFLENLGKTVIPGSETIALIQDKYIQKTTLKQAGIPVPEFVEVLGEKDYDKIVQVLGERFVLKSRKMGYDGYGNALITNRKKFEEAVKSLGERHSKLMAEKFVPFAKELAVMVVRTDDEEQTYPVVETVQKDHICHTVIAPADVDRAVEKSVREIALEAVRAVHGKGLFGVEFFMTADNVVLVNEMAPRPHNTGHYTMEACVTSQFENHVRAVMGWKTGSCEMNVPHAVMINLLGKREGPGVPDNYGDAFEDPQVHLHIYGKEKSRKGRKMGHITVTGSDPELLLKKAGKIEKDIIL